MSKAIWLSATGLVVAVGMLAVGYVAGRPEAAIANDAPQVVALASAESTANRTEIENIVRDYLVKNPELLLDMQQALETKQREEQRIANLEVIKSAKDDIFNAAYDGYVGNPAGKTTIVEFYDYNCGYCKRAQEDMLALTSHAGACVVRYTTETYKRGPLITHQSIQNFRWRWNRSMI